MLSEGRGARSVSSPDRRGIVPARARCHDDVTRGGGRRLGARPRERPPRWGPRPAPPGLARPGQARPGCPRALKARDGLGPRPPRGGPGRRGRLFSSGWPAPAAVVGVPRPQRPARRGDEPFVTDAAVVTEEERWAGRKALNRDKRGLRHAPSGTPRACPCLEPGQAAGCSHWDMPHEHAGISPGLRLDGGPFRALDGGPPSIILLFYFLFFL